MLKPLFSLLAIAASLAMPIAHAQAILAASVNGVGISEEQLEQNFEEHLKQQKINLLQIRNPERLKQIKRVVLDNLIEQELFWQAAQKAGTIAMSTEVDEAYQSTQGQFKTAESFDQRIRIEGFTPETYRQLVKKQVSATKYANSVAAKAAAVTDKEIHRFYLDNPDKFRRPALVHARHIVMQIAKGASDSERAEKRSRIEEILKQARAGQDFEKLARLHSEAPTKQWGGQMDPFSRGQVAKLIEDVAFALAPGQISDVVTTPESYQILKIDSRSDAISISEKQARDKIREYLQALKARQAINREAEQLRAAGDVKIILPL
jgi:parvulin-like peptidyl-prolyl isomerase